MKAQRGKSWFFTTDSGMKKAMKALNLGQPATESERVQALEQTGGSRSTSSQVANTLDIGSLRH
jgi:hypothetical protein